MEDKTENGDQCGRNGRRRGTAQNNAEERTEEKGQIQKEIKSKGAQEDREREERHC